VVNAQVTGLALDLKNARPQKVWLLTQDELAGKYCAGDESSLRSAAKFPSDSQLCFLPEEALASVS